MSGKGKTENSESLSHLIYHCPGIHGKGSKQDIKRKTFRQFFQENGRLIIPLFQRRYCWSDKTVWHWFEDVVRGKRDHLGIHNSGNVIVKKSAHGEGLIIIDGQQRITTTIILLSAIRDELTTLAKENCEQLTAGSRQTLEKCQKELESMIFLNGISSKEVDLEFRDGEDFTNCRLLPSFCDRKPFFQLMSFSALNIQEKEEISYQAKTKQIFKSRISQQITEKTSVSNESKVEWISELVHQALDLMGITYVEIINDVNMAQVFLWLQEKSLFGEAALCYNPTPGLYFTAVDMARNLLLSPTMNQSIQDQELFYRKHWLEPIEANFAGHHQVDNFNQCLADFVKMKTENISHVSVSESTYLKTVNTSKSISPKGKQYITTYAKLISFYEKIGNNLDKKEITNSEQTEPTNEDMKEASKKICAEIAEFISRKNLEEIKKKETWE